MHNIPRIALKLHYVPFFERNAEIGQKDHLWMDTKLNDAADMKE